MNKKEFCDRIDFIVTNLKQTKNIKEHCEKIKELFVENYDFDQLSDIYVYGNLTEDGIQFEWDINEYKIDLDCSIENNILNLESYHKELGITDIAKFQLNKTGIGYLNRILLDAKTKYILKYNGVYGRKESFILLNKEHFINKVKSINNEFGIFFGEIEVLFNNGNDLLNYISFEKINDNDNIDFAKYGIFCMKQSCFYEQLRDIINRNEYVK